MCLRKIDELKKNNQRFHFEKTFGCCYEQKIEYFATVCEKYPYNAFMFDRNYFASIGCSYFSANKELIYAFCSHLKEHLNYHVKKACIEVSDKKDLPFQVIPLKKHLYDIKADLFFVFHKQHEYFEVMIDHPSYKTFFMQKLLIKEMNFDVFRLFYCPCISSYSKNVFSI